MNKTRYSLKERKKEAGFILKALKSKYPDITPPLFHRNAHELLIAVILSAQSTDKNINNITPALFEKYETVEDFANANIDELKEMIRKSGFYNQKAKNIRATANMIVDKFGGEVPDTMEELVQLPGVARKTANIILSDWFGKNEGIAVDTHVKRVSYRLGLTDQADPVKIERDLMELFPKEEWGEISLRLVFHGRETCTARKPKHEMCCLCSREEPCSID